MKRIYLCLVIAFSFSLGQTAKAQKWVEMMLDPSVNFYTVQAEFNKWYNESLQKINNQQQSNQQNTKSNSTTGKKIDVTPTVKEIKGNWKLYKRWEEYVEPRVYPTGDRSQIQKAIYDYQQSLITGDNSQNNKNGPSTQSQGPSNPSIQAGNWSLVGPINTVPTFGGAGRINAVRVDPLVATTFYACAPAGGLWKSTNSGASWTMWNTDALAAIGATDIAIHPTNTQIMYLASGDGDAGDTYSLGVLKSIDGGVTWTTTGLNWAVTLGRTISKLLIDPSTPNTVHAATSNGIYRTTDAGVTWVQVQTGSFKDMELRPGTPGTVYAASATQVYRSTNSGASYTSVYTVTGANRLALAVTAANNQYVYVLAGSNANSGFLSFHRSTNAGTSFTPTTVSSPSNILGWASAGNDVGGQSWYDLALAASPTNANECVAGGVNIWRTTNGGTNWTLNAHWTGSGAPYVHADIHDLVYTSATTVTVGCDGGVFRTTNNGTAWSDLSAGLQIAQMYCLGTSATNANMNISGWQDNGTNRVTSGVWQQVIGGDGMECLIDYTTTNIQYGELYYGRIYRTANNWGAATQIVNSGGTGVNANGNWVTPYIIHPTTNTTLLVGKAFVYRSTNSGTSWTQLGTLTGGTGNVVSIAYAPSNPNYIYCAKSNAMYVSTNGGTSFTNVTTGLSGGSITDIAVSASDPLRVYVTISGYTSGSKVFLSTNAGTSWTNYSTGLPNLPANTIIYQTSTPDGVYVGTDVGVYYRDNSMGTWVNYFTGLPNVIVKELEIQYSSGKIRAATYGRGMWESNLYSSGSSAPMADFTSNYTSGCPGMCFNFTDLSAFNPTSWAWTFTGAVPSSSTAQNPTNICYAAPGVYAVTLVATNVNGNSTNTKTAYITIQSAGPLPFVEGFQSLPFLPTNWLQKDIGNDGLYWQRSTTVGGFSTSTASAWFDNYTLNAGGARDEMWSPKFVFSSVTTCSMTFDVAYQQYDNTFSDSLAVLVSTDCGQNWTQVYMKGGLTLSTAGASTVGFVPTSTQWRTETINLNAYAGQATVMFSFQNRGRWGNNLYIDNINLAYTQSSGAPVAAFTASATSGCPNSCFNFTDNSTNSPTSWAWTFTGAVPASSTAQNPTNICYAAAGTYTVTLVATNGSGSSTTSQTITINPSPTVAATPSAPSYCTGGSVAITASGANTYIWTPATGLSATTGATVTANPTATTTYTITGTSTLGCTGTTTVTVTVNTAPTVTKVPASPSYCTGGSVSITASGANTYAWTPATGLSATTGATVTANPTATTTYTITGTATNGCTGTTTVTVTVNPNPTVTATPSAPSFCTGGSVSITASGANTYAWAPATGLSATTGATVTANPTATTTYTITGTSAAGCTNTTTVTVTLNTAPTVSASPGSPSYCTGGSVSITASGANTYAWAPATGLSSTTGTTVSANPTVTTTYTITGTAANGCTNTTTVTVTVNSNPAVSITPSAVTICPSGSANLTASGAVTYVWSPATGLSATTGAVVSASPTVTTTYTVTGTNASGCTNTSTATVTMASGLPVPFSEGFQSLPFLPVGWTMVDDANDGNIWQRNTIVGGFSGTGSCAWYRNNTINAPNTRDEMHLPSFNFSSLTSAQMTFDVAYCRRTNAAFSDTCVVYVSTNCGATWIQVYSKGGTTLATAPNQNGSFTPTTTQWRIETVNLTPYIGQANVIIKFQNRNHNGNNLYIDNINITGSSSGAPVAAFTASATSGCPNSCFNFTDNSTNTPTSWAWSFPGGTPSSSTLQNPTNICYATAGTYTVTLVATNGSGSSTTSQTITINANPTVTCTPSSAAICNGSSTSLTAGGANTYVWTPATGLSATTGATVIANPTTTTTYTITGTSVAGCTNTTTVVVTVNPLPTITKLPAAPSYCVGSSVSITASGGVTYAWSPASGLSATTGATVTANPTTTTTYTITGTNTFGCTNTTTVTATVNPLPTISATPSTPTICSSGSVSITASGGVTYAWSPASGLSATTGATVTATPTTTTTYTITGTNTFGCTNTTTVTVTVTPVLTITISPSPVSICVGSSTPLTASGALTYAWGPATGLSATTGATVTANPTTTTTYTVTGTSGSCSSTSSVTVTVNLLPPAPVISQVVNVLTSTIATTYQWYLNSVLIPGATNQSYTISTSGTYEVCITDANGCSACSGPYSAIFTGINDPMLGGSINIFPNPSNGEFQVSFTLSNTDDYVIEITDGLGQIVYKEELKNFNGTYNQQFDITKFGAGIYMFTLKNSANQSVKKIITW